MAACGVSFRKLAGQKQPGSDNKQGGTEEHTVLYVDVLTEKLYAAARVVNTQRISQKVVAETIRAKPIYPCLLTMESCFSLRLLRHEC